MKSASIAAICLSALALCLLMPASRACAAENQSLAMTENATPPPAIVVALRTATDGLLMPSETDAPFKVVFFAREIKNPAAKTEVEGEIDPKVEGHTKIETKAAISREELARLAGAPVDAKIETRDLDEFFAASIAIEDWMNDDEKATAARFAALLEVLKTQLEGAQVLVWGDAEKQVAILGESEGDVAGVTTLVVET